MAFFFRPFVGSTGWLITETRVSTGIIVVGCGPSIKKASPVSQEMPFISGERGYAKATRRSDALRRSEGVRRSRPVLSSMTLSDGWESCRLSSPLRRSWRARRSSPVLRSDAPLRSWPERRSGMWSAYLKRRLSIPVRLPPLSRIS